MIRGAAGYVTGSYRAMGYLMALGARLPNQLPGSAICADVEFFSMATASDALPSGLHRDRAQPIVLFVSRFIGWKRGIDVIDAFSRSRARLGGQLWMVGSGEEEDRYRAAMRRNELDDAVKIVPFQHREALRAVYRNADVLVLSSASEPWGLVIHEAMSAGTPVIATNGSGAAERLIRSGQNGFIYQPGDVQALAQLLDRFAGDPSLRTTLGTAARSTALELSPQSVALDWVRAATAALADRRPRQE
jgi:glycosyltransferase involved in cell wall biosynthesis